MGNSEIACPILNALKKSKHQILSVVSNSPKALGRGLTYQYTPVGKLANKLDLKLISVDSLKNKQFISTIETLQADIFVVVAFRILPSILLSLTNKAKPIFCDFPAPKYAVNIPVASKATPIPTISIDTKNCIMSRLPVLMSM